VQIFAIYLKNSHSAIISPEVFDLVQDEKKRRKAYNSKNYICCNLKLKANSDIIRRDIKKLTIKIKSRDNKNKG
jgi:hypothetical protein